MPDIVVDTNQFLSAFLFHGMMKVVFDLVLDDKLQLYISLTLRAEVLEKMHSFGASKQALDEVVFFLETRGTLIEPTIKVTACRDAEDNFALELAESSRADYLITRDKDLLDLHEWKNTKIIKPEEFLPILRKMRLID